MSDLPRSRQGVRPVPEGALLRLPIDDPQWAESVPPVPAGYEVTVSFNSLTTAAEHADALRLLGYTPVGVHPAPVASAMLLVTQDLLETYPKYWRSLTALADAAYSLSHGPALRLLDGALRLHIRSA